MKYCNTKITSSNIRYSIDVIIMKYSVHWQHVQSSRSTR